jgi:polysaccharide transporter, PST family
MDGIVETGKSVSTSPPSQGHDARKGSDVRRLFDNIAAMFALQAASYILPLLTLPYLARVLGPAKFGSVAFAQATVQYFVILTDFGFNLSATRAVALRRSDPAAVSAIFVSVIIAKSLLAALGVLVLATAALFAPLVRDEWALFASAYGLVVAQVFMPVWFFQGIERMRPLAFLSIGAKVVFTALVFALVRTHGDYVLVPLLNASGAAVASAAALWIAFVHCGVRFRIPAFTIVRQLFRESVGYFASRVAAAVYTSSNVFFLGATSTANAVGMYSASERIYGALQGVYSPVTNALLPFMARTRDRRVFATLLCAASMANALVCLLIACFADRIVAVAFGAAYAQAAGPLRFLAAAMIVVLPNYFLGYPLLAAFGHARLANASTVIGSIAHLSGLVVLWMAGWITPINVSALVCGTELLVLAARVVFVARTGIWRMAQKPDAPVSERASDAAASGSPTTVV